MAKIERVLIIEDDRTIALVLETLLSREGYKTRVAPDAASGLAEFDRRRPDLVIVDWQLPDGTGIEVIRSIRETSQASILLLTSRGDVDDKVVGLDAGADDYMTKPFDVRELGARVRALMRRNAGDAPPERVLTVGPLRADLEARTATLEGRPLDLTRVEFDLLAYMLSNPGVALSREALLDSVWGYKLVNYRRTVDTHMWKLRSKLEADPEQPLLIHTVRGVGYRLEYRPP